MSERINGDVSLWAAVKKQNVKTFTSSKKSTVKLRSTSVDLKETKDLCGRVLVLARSKEIDQKKTIGTYEFTQTPRALFASDGEILPCNNKSKLIHHLEKLVQEHTTAEDQGGEVDEQHPATSQDRSHHRIATVDDMVLLHKLTKKPSTIHTAKDLSTLFYDRLMSSTSGYDEIVVVFDTYKSDSLKHSTRQRRNQGQHPGEYQIKDETSIKNITMRRFLSHDNTKSHLTEYLAAKTVEYAESSSKVTIASAAGICISMTFMYIAFLVLKINNCAKLYIHR